MRLKKIITLAITVALSFSVQAFANVEALPEVSEEMLSPDYWTNGMKDADKVLVDEDEIKRLNESYLSCKDCCMNDLEAFEETFDGEKENLARWKGSMTDLAKFLDGKHYDESDNIISGKYVMDILNNLDDPDASKTQQVRYGIAVHRSDVRVYPTDLIIADDPGDSDFDNIQNSSIRIGEPVVIHSSSTDGNYYYCYTSCVSGWIPAEDIAVCRDRNEWLAAWHIPDDEVMVVTDSKITLEDSNTNPEFTGLMLTMGTVLEKVQPYEYGKMIANRSSYYNYPVWIPVRDENGMYARKRALVSVHHGLSDGYLPLTSENIIKQAYTKLGDTYGWGGMLTSVDCSGYVRDVYKCFGLELPRNTTWQSAMPIEKYDLSLADDDDKKELFDSLPPGSILFFKGHEMLYLGHDEDRYYVISATSSMMYPGTQDKARVRSVIINTLDVKRANGNTWLTDLYEAAVPYVANEENIMEPVFKVKETSGSSKKAPVTEGEEEEDEDGQPYEEIAFDKTWEFADSSKINDGIARLYRSEEADRKDLTICINAGHGTKGGADVKTPCHPDGSPKIVSGSTAAGATEATAIARGCIMANGDLEAEATLKAAMVTKEELLKAGYDVLMIRETDDVQLDNIARTLIANNCADAHIALHYDSTATGKGVFFCSVPDDENYKNMEPVRSYWELHDKLGKSLVYGLNSVGFPKWNNGELEMDLTQTSFSTVPSVDLEIGDTSSDYSYKELVRVAEGIRKGLDLFYDRTVFNEKDVMVKGDNHDIPATVCIPKGDGPFAAVVMLHGTGSDRDEAGDTYVMAAHSMAADHGIATIRIDFPGCGDSKADSTEYDYGSAVEDAVAAAGYLEGLGNIDMKRIGVMGWSQGGTDALLACARHPGIFSSVVTWAGAPDLEAVGLFTDEDYKEAEKTGSFEMKFEFRDSLKTSKQWCDDVKNTKVLEEFADNYTGPVLAIAGTNDETVDPKQSEDITASSKNTQSRLYLIDDMDHTFNVFSENDLHSMKDAINETGEFFADTLKK